MRRILLSAAATAFIMWFLLYAPMPFVLFQPGIAIPVGAMIQVAQGDAVDGTGNEDSRGNPMKETEGSLLLTAVKLTEPNFLGVLQASFKKDFEIYRKSDVFRGATRRQYVRQLSVVMQDSQNHALEAAYRYLSIPYHHQTTLIIAAGKVEALAGNNGGFEPGDVLLGFPGEEPFADVEDMLDRLGGIWKAGQRADIEAERDGGRIIVSAESPENGLHGELTLERLVGQLNIGGFVEHKEIVPDNPAKKLSISANNIGGPSAGLVFALEGIQLLEDGDLTGGYAIAATGSIQPDGTVGAIGGVSQKVVSVSEEGAVLFLVPKDNEEEARKRANGLHRPLAIVGVDTLGEAVNAIQAFIRERGNG